MLLNSIDFIVISYYLLYKFFFFNIMLIWIFLGNIKYLVSKIILNISRHIQFECSR